MLTPPFSRFYRNGLESELLIRELRENVVEVQSYTEQIGNDPVGDLCRRIISLFNEFLSDEIARHVKRSQKENARQGFWNVGPTPFGYRVVDAERRGDTIKKKLGIAPDEAEIVRAMFERYLHGDGKGGSSGVLRIAEWLNAEGYRTRNGARWGNSIVHRLLTDTTYKGAHVWDRDADDPDDRVVVPVPAIVAAGTFDKVARTLEARNPKKTPPRETTGGNLLTGMATSSVCGSSMTTATGKSGAYTYYRCSRKNRQGAEACTNVNVPMADLDALVIDALSSQLLDPESLAAVLEATHGRQIAAQGKQTERLARMQADLDEAEASLKRLYDGIESGILDPSEPTLAERVTTARARRDRLRKAVESTRAPASAGEKITPEKTAAFKAEDGTMQRGFVCQTLNPWGYPAKDRSGRLNMVEPPHLGRLMYKLRQPATPAHERLTYAAPPAVPAKADPSQPQS